MTWIGTPGLDSLTMDGELAVALGTITSDEKLFNGTATWNAGGVTFTGIKANITDTSSASASLLLDLQVGGSTKFKVDKTGTITTVASSSLFRSLTGTATILTTLQGDPASTVTPTAPSLLAQTYLSASSSVYYALRGHMIPYAGTDGIAVGVHGDCETESGGTWVSGAGTRQFIGVLGEARSIKANSRIWGGIFNAKSLTAAASEICGVEINLDTRIAPTNRYGLQVVSVATSVAVGGTDDMAFRITNRTSSAKWKEGIVFDGQAGVLFPVETTGTLIKTSGSATITTGIDFSSVTITGNMLSGPNGSTITGAGRILAHTGDTSAPSFAIATDSNTGMYGVSADVLGLLIGGNIGAQLSAPGDGETALLVRRNVSAAFSLQRVSMGAADSGGAGFKLLRVAN